MTVLGPLGIFPEDSAARADAAPGIEGLPESFRTALAELRRARPRDEAAVEEVPAPRRLAPFAVALRADAPAGEQGAGGDPTGAADPALAAGRMILLHDPKGQQAWGGTFRVVIYIRAELDPEMGNDPLLASVAWTWLSEALDQHGVSHSHAGGTATRILSESFGSLHQRPVSNDVELRASWTPGDLAFSTHLEAWADMVCSFAGLPPVPDGVVAMPHIRRGGL